MSITFNNTVFQAGFVGEDDGGPKGGVKSDGTTPNTFGLDSVSTNSVTVNGTVSKPGDSVTVTGLLPNADGADQTSPITLYVTQYDTSGYIQFNDTPPYTGGGTQPTNYYANSYRYILSNNMLTQGQKVGGDNDPTLSEYQVACFASGTLIRTANGDVAVERLAIGDLALTASGEHRPIRWIGSRTIGCLRHPCPSNAFPVRVKAHAFADDLPARDLLVSPGHSLCCDAAGEVLVPAMALVNGTTIAQEPVDHVTYWHVELGSHDIILAENMPTESYLEMGNRDFFAESAVVGLSASPDAPMSTHADFCRPFHVEGVVVEAVRSRLAERAKMLGWTLEEQGLGGVHLEIDGRRMDPQGRILAVRFTVPATAREVWLVSQTAVPAFVVTSPDHRSLGVPVLFLTIDDGFTAPATVAVDDPRLSIGFHEVERDGEATWRWTNGRALLPSDLWAGVEGDFFLRVDLRSPVLPRWVAPTLFQEAQSPPSRVA